MTARRRPRWSELQPLLRPAGVRLRPAERRLAQAASVADLRLLAQRRAPRAVFDYTDGAAGEELSLQRSRQAFARVGFKPRGPRPGGVPASRAAERLGRGSVDDDLGRPSALPLVFAPTGFTRMMHTEG